MSDDRWVIRVCNGDVCSECSELTACPKSKLVEVMPVSPVVPLALLREWIDWLRIAQGEASEFVRGFNTALAKLDERLDEFDRTTNHNEGAR